MVAATGNTIPQPPRLSGDYQTDYPRIVEWLGTLYQTLALEQNVTGTQDDLTARVARIEEANGGSAPQVEANTAAIAGIAGLDYLTGTISGTYEPQQLADAWDKINAIIGQARGL